MNIYITTEDGYLKQTLAKRCVQSCMTWLVGIEWTKTRIAIDFQEALESQEKLFQLALNEAEDLAWLKAYPHLLFPMLAVEKVQSVAAWHSRQQSLNQRRNAFTEAV